MHGLREDDRGYPVPAFVAEVDGVPDFRLADSLFREATLRQKRCWVCGKDFTTRHRWYVLGPMCVINRNTSEPPCHLDCAEYSVAACPFLRRPHATRRDNAMPDGASLIAGYISRNPGVTALYATREFRLHRLSRKAGDYLIELGAPDEVAWYCQGREATRAEVLDSISGGLQALIDEASKQGPKALVYLKQQCKVAIHYLPKRTSEAWSAEDAALLAWGYRIGEAERRVLEGAL
jgi:hypothetical protein